MGQYYYNDQSDFRDLGGVDSGDSIMLHQWKFRQFSTIMLYIAEWCTPMLLYAHRNDMVLQ